MNGKILIVLIIAFAFTGTIYAQQPDTINYEALFPSPLKGWKASEVTVQEDPIEEPKPSTVPGVEPKHLRLARTYNDQANGGQIVMGIDTWDCVTSGMILGPEATADKKKGLEKKGIRPFSYKSYDGLQVYDERKRLSMIVLKIDSCKIYAIAIEQFGKKDTIMKYLKELDLDTVREFMKKH